MLRHTSLIPRPLLPPVFDHFQYVNMVLEMPGRSHHVSCNVRYTEGRHMRGEWPTKYFKDNLCNVFTGTRGWNIHKATPIQLYCSSYLGLIDTIKTVGLVCLPSLPDETASPHTTTSLTLSPSS